MKNKHQRVLYELLHERPVAYSPKLTFVLGSVKAAVLMSQLLYWSDKGIRKDGYIYKTIEEMKEETALSRAEQDSAIKRCKQLKVLDVILKSIPAKRHFKIDVERLIDLISDWSKDDKQAGYISSISIEQAKQSITDKTQESTQNNNFKNKGSKREVESRRKDILRSKDFLTKNMTK